MSKELFEKMSEKYEKLVGQPLVSVIIPCYNREHVILRAIESVLKQTYDNVEVIIVDDGSMDKSYETIKKEYHDDERIIVIKQKENRGVAHARNIGINNANGKFIAFLDSDDEWKPEHLRKAITGLESTSIDMFMAMWEIEQDGTLHGIETSDDGEAYFSDAIEQLNAKKCGTNYIFGKGIFEFSVLERFYFFHINTLVVTKKLLCTCGLFNEHFETSEDTDLILRLLQNSNKLLFSKEYHFIYHQSEDGIYSFLNQQKINIDNVREKNKIIMKKILKINQQKIEVRKQCAKCLEENDVVYFDMAEFRTLIDDYISKKYVYMAYIGSAKMRFQSLHYILKAMRYCHNQSEKKFLFRLILDTICLKSWQAQELLVHMNYW